MQNLFLSMSNWRYFSELIKVYWKDPTDYFFLLVYELEEFADFPNPIYFSSDLNFYWYSNRTAFFNFKLFFKIKKSLKLRVPYLYNSHLKKCFFKDLFFSSFLFSKWKSGLKFVNYCDFSQKNIYY